MAKKTSQAGATAEPVKERPLTWSQERFVEAYVENGGNATQAYRKAYPRSAPDSWDASGPRLLGNVRILRAIESFREADRQALAFDRRKALLIYVGMALARQSDFVKVMKDPMKRNNYAGLGILEYGLESAEKTVSDTEFGTNVKTSIKLVNRKAAVDELWIKLGLGEEARKGNWFDGLDRIAELISGTERKK